MFNLVPFFVSPRRVNTSRIISVATSRLFSNQLLTQTREYQDVVVVAAAAALLAKRANKDVPQSN
jgi:hypothetical protein